MTSGLVFNTHTAYDMVYCTDPCNLCSRHFFRSGISLKMYSGLKGMRVLMLTKIIHVNISKTKVPCIKFHQNLSKNSKGKRYVKVRKSVFKPVRRVVFEMNQTQFSLV
jgi:hypothetical protein